MADKMRDESYLDDLDAVALLEEAKKLYRRINSPITEQFLEGVQLEVAHQVTRWGAAHDRGKSPADWLWLVAMLTTKAMVYHMQDNHTKAMHHTISSAAALANWHEHIRQTDRNM